MKTLVPMLVLVALAVGMPAFAADREHPATLLSLAQGPSECASPTASPTEAGPSWLESAPTSEGFTAEAQNLFTQGCSVQNCNRRCAWCQIACDGYCTVFGGICQCQ